MQNEPSPLLCVLCHFHLQAPEAISYAKFVVNGMSVCGAHVGFAKDSHDFHSARTKMMHAHNEMVLKLAQKSGKAS